MKRDRSFWIFVALIVLAALAFSVWYYSKLPVVESRIESLTQLQEQQLSLYSQRVGVLLTLATLVLGAAGAILWHSWDKRPSRLMQRLAVLSLVSSGLSVWFGYFAFDAAIWMLRAEFFNLGSNAVRLPSTLQLISSAISVAMLILAFLAGPGGEKEKRQ